ncbi:MAG: disulfide bond formation protein B [Gammaproteobacteria bacterium]
MKAFFQNYLDFFITFCSGFVVLSQYYLENIEGLTPCNLCLIQSYAARTIFIIFLLKILTPILKIYFDILGILALTIGLSAGSRQIYLQNLPKDQLPDGLCDMPFDVVFNIYPFFEGIQKIFIGSSKCAEEVWTFLSLNIAEWSTVYFASMILLILLRYLLIFTNMSK